MDELPPDDKHNGLGGKATPMLLIVLQISIFLPLSSAAEIHAVSFGLSQPPFLSGALESNAILAEAERGHEGNISAPHSYVEYKDEIYAVTAAGTVENVTPCRPVVIARLAPRSCIGPKQCGKLVSIRLSSKGMFLVLDAYRGVFEVHPITGVTRQLYSSRTIVNGRPSYYLSDIMEQPDGTLVISDASATFDYASRFWIMFEGRADGRLIEFNPNTGQMKEIMAGLAYPSGLELTTDRSAFLLAEAARAKIYRVELDRGRRYHKSIFHENLPGIPDHIRQTDKGSYWVGIAFPRYRGEVSVMDQYSNRPAARDFLAKMRSEQQLKMMYNKRGLAVELDADGRIIHSMHDLTSSNVAEVTEVNEHGGLAYVGSRNQNAVIRVMTSARRLTIGSMLQVMRSKCKVTEDKIPEAREALQRQVLISKNAATASQKLPGSNIPPTPATTTAQSLQAPLQSAYGQDRQPTGQQKLRSAGGSDQTEARTTKSIRQGLSRIQKILNRSGIHNTKAITTRTSPQTQQVSNPPHAQKQSVPQPAVITQQRPWTSKNNQPPQPQRHPQIKASNQQQYMQQPPRQNSFPQPNKQAYVKPQFITQVQNNPPIFSGRNRVGSQAPPFPGAPPIRNNKMYQNSRTPTNPQNVLRPPNAPIPLRQHGQPLGGTGQVYAPNGNVPLPFSVTGHQNRFAGPMPPPRIVTRPNLQQPPIPYQNINIGPKNSYRPPPNPAPMDLNSPFLPHGLVPTGHHKDFQSARHDGGNKPQIVHKVVNGQMISQIIVPNLDATLYDVPEPTTTVSPFSSFLLPIQRPGTDKIDMFKPQMPPQTPPQMPPQVQLQSEKEKKIALGGFLGIAQKASIPAQKPPLFNLGPEMINTLPEFGQLPSSALDASPIALYGLDSSTRPPTAAESNAAAALSMFTGVSNPSERKEQQQQQQRSQDPPPSSSFQGQEQSYNPQTQFSDQPTNTVTAQEIPPTTATVADDKNSLKKEATDIQRMQMLHPGEGIISPAAPQNTAINADAKSSFQDTKQSFLKRGLQNLQRLFRQNNSHNPRSGLSIIPSQSPITSATNSKAQEPQTAQHTLQTKETTTRVKGDGNSGHAAAEHFLSGVVGTSATFVSQENIALSSSRGEPLPAKRQQDTPLFPDAGPTPMTSNTEKDLTPTLPSGTPTPTVSDTQQLKIGFQKEKSLYSSLVDTQYATNLGSHQVQQPQQESLQNIQSISSFPSQSPVPNNQESVQTPSPRPENLGVNNGNSLPGQSEQPPLSPPQSSSPNQDQQIGNSHGFIQIYQNGKYVVIPLSQNMLQTLSSTLGATGTNQQAPNSPPLTTSENQNTQDTSKLSTGQDSISSTGSHQSFTGAASSNTGTTSGNHQKGTVYGNSPETASLVAGFTG